MNAVATVAVPWARRRAVLAEQLDASRRGVMALGGALGQLEAWGAELRVRLERGGRLLVAGNGGSAALAQHLTAELVGRYDRDRRPYSALALSAETSSLTAIGNDYGFERSFARQVEAHGRPGDVFLGLTTSGRSPNLLAAVISARKAGVTSWAMTGPAPNPLANLADDTVAVPCGSTATIQDVQQVAVHLLCRAFELADPDLGPETDPEGDSVPDPMADRMADPDVEVGSVTDAETDVDGEATERAAGASLARRAGRIGNGDRDGAWLT